MNVVILAAGVGKRMHSRLPKVLQPIAGRPMLARVIDTARQLPDARIIIVIGHQGDRVRAALDAPDLHWAVQAPQLGTGDAVRQALPSFDDSDSTLVLYGDVPLTRIETLRDLSRLAAEGSGALAVLTVAMAEPTGYGRIVRTPDGTRIVGIVEEKDATPQQRAIGEVNSGILVAPTAALRRWLGRLSNDNAQGEYYLTDVVALANADGIAVVAAQAGFAWETTGVNDKAQLAALERRFQRSLADALLVAGVTLADPSRIDIRGTLRCGSDVWIDVGCVFEGTVQLDDGASIGPYAVLRDTHVAANALVEAHAHVIGPDSLR